MVSRPFNNLPNTEYLVMLGVAIVIAVLAAFFGALVRRILGDRRRESRTKPHESA
ncbi:MAG: hypothetical protein WBG50_28875 [Desulfomonilaceae bacterium]